MGKYFKDYNGIRKCKSNKNKTFEGSQIIYGTTETEFGKYFMALIDNQICSGSFVSESCRKFTELQNTFPKAELLRNDSLIQETFKKYFDTDEKPSLFLIGTDLELKVWEYLIKLRKGKLTNYTEIANYIKYPNGEKAVEKAIARSQIAFFIPCHKIQSKNKRRKRSEIMEKMFRYEETWARKNMINSFQLVTKKTE